jgi:hypothetical protein
MHNGQRRPAYNTGDATQAAQAQLAPWCWKQIARQLLLDFAAAICTGAITANNSNAHLHQWLWRFRLRSHPWAGPICSIGGPTIKKQSIHKSHSSYQA